MTNPDEATRSTSSPLPNLAPLFSLGFPADIDTDPVEDRALSDLLAKLHQDFEVRSIRRAQLYGDWIHFPSLPLEYAVWLLLGRDPLEAEPPLPSLLRRFRRAITLLENEIILQRLRPVGKAVIGFPRHFLLSAVAMAAKRIRLEEDTAAQILELIGNIGKEAHPTLAWQTERINRRVVVHTRLVQQFLSTQPELVKALPVKKHSRRQRRGGNAPLNVQLAEREIFYDEAFRKLYESTYGGAPEYDITADMLRADRDHLNVKFKGGRPKTSSRQPIRKR